MAVCFPIFVHFFLKMFLEKKVWC